MDLWNINDIRYLLKKYKFDYSHSLGQNFLIDQHVCPKIVEMSNISKNTGVIEIGPGIGVFTVEIARAAKKVVAIEIDKRLLPILNETLTDYDNIKIINQDILKTDLKEIIKTEFDNRDIVVCANLPYYITSSIIMYLLTSNLKIKSITVMVQKEVAERITATPGSREAGVLSLAVRYYSEPKILFDVSKNSFNPRPKVDSSVINLSVRTSKLVSVKSEKLFFKVIKAAFSKRRKTVINSLSSVLTIDKPILNDIFNKIDIDPNKRAENLSLENFRDIANSLFDMNMN